MLVAAHDHSGGYGPNGTYSYYVTSMNTDGSDAKKITDVSDDEIYIVGANNDTVYLFDPNGHYFAVPVAGGDKTDIGLPDVLGGDARLIGADDHIIVSNGALLGATAHNVGSMKVDGSSYVEYFSWS